MPSREENMMTRRSFCCSTAVATVVSFAPGVLLAEKTSGVLTVSVQDTRLEQSRAFSQRLAEHGVPIFSYTADPSRLWLGTLADQLHREPSVLTGLTGQGALFCLERWAWDLGMRVAMRVDHVETVARGFWHHATAADLTPIAAAGAAFGGHMAELLLASRAIWSDHTHAAPPKVADMIGEQLVSWIIAPLSDPSLQS